jgi:pSer/pThr/pTyr-binding forkhead associated (FHA) protein
LVHFLVISNNHSCVSQGPICKIGRRADNCISFPTDQSISRVHAEIHIDGSNALLKDLGSKFGTYYTDSNNNSELAVFGSLTNLISGQIVTFGRLSSTVRFVKEYIHFCTTRLDTKEKGKVQSAANIIGAKVSQSPENATHIITNSISGATAKILAAIVFKKKIVTTEWLKFTESPKPSEHIRPIEE